MASIVSEVKKVALETKQRYEIIFIVKSTIADEEVSKAIDKVRSTIERGSGEIEWVENMGKKKLAYEVKKEKKGVYILIHFKGKGNIVFDVERTCRLEETIIKFMTIKLNPLDVRPTLTAPENSLSQV